MTFVYDNPRSLAYRFRARRFVIVNALIERILAARGRCTVLDIGGTPYYWRINAPFMAAHAGKVSVITVNLPGGPPEDALVENDYLTPAFGDATDPATYEGFDFDLVHSNSVIEHVGPWPRIRAMAEAIRGAGRPYYVQTPNLWFPVEPHYRSLFFQFLPPETRARRLMRRQHGFRGPAASWDAAMEIVESINLLSPAQMRALFPEARIVRERVWPLTKSLIAIRDP
jgi:hypothetical protein